MMDTSKPLENQIQNEKKHTCKRACELNQLSSQSCCLKTIKNKAKFSTTVKKEMDFSVYKTKFVDDLRMLHDAQVLDDQCVTYHHEGHQN